MDAGRLSLSKVQRPAHPSGDRSDHRPFLVRDKKAVSDSPEVFTPSVAPSPSWRADHFFFLWNRLSQAETITDQMPKNAILRHPQFLNTSAPG